MNYLIMDRSRTAEKLVSEQIPKRRMGASHVDTYVKNIPGRGDCMGTGPDGELAWCDGGMTRKSVLLE